MSFYLALQYWRNGPAMLGDALLRPSGAQEMNITITPINSRCEGQASFENSMAAFSGQNTRPDVIVGCLCSVASLAVGRFSTAFGIPMLATASQSTDLSNKVEYPYVFRWCTTEVTDADMHAGLLAKLKVKRATVIYVDSARGVKQKDRLLSRPSMQSVSTLVVRLPDVDMTNPTERDNTVAKLRTARSSPAFVFVCYLAFSYGDLGEKLVLEAAGPAGLLNNYTIFLFAETMLGELEHGSKAEFSVDRSVRRSLVGSMVGRAQPVAARFRAWKDWMQTISMSDLMDLGFDAVSGNMEDEQWIGDPDNFMLPWHSFRFDATIGLLQVVHEMRLAGEAVSAAGIESRFRALSLPGIMGDLSWDAEQNRQGLVYEILQLQHQDAQTLLPPALVRIGELVLDGSSQADINGTQMSFQGTPPRQELVYLEAPGCPDGMSKPDAFSMDSECVACPRGSFSSMQTGGICLPCQAGLFGDSEGQSRCKSCPLGAFTNTSGAEECTLCPLGRATVVAGAIACDECSKGKFAGIPGSTECSWCPLGRYQPGPHASSCMACEALLPGSSTASRGAEGQDECICPDGSYKPMGVGVGCQTCPDGMTCMQGSAEEHLPSVRELNVSCGSSSCTYPVPSLGFYVQRESPLSVYRCVPDAACPGGAAEACTEGMEGLACGACAVGLYRDALGMCSPCSSVAQSSFLFPILPLISGLPITILMHRTSQDPLPLWGSPFNSAMAVAYTVLVYVQTLATFRSVYVDLPKLFSEFTGWSDNSVAILSLLRADCVAFSNFQVRFIGQLFLPLYVLIVVAATFGLTKLLVRFLPSRLPKILLLDKDITFNCYGSAFFTFYMGIVSQTLSLFQCYAHPNNESSLRSAPHIICYSGTWQEMLAAAVIAIILFCISPLGLVCKVIRDAPQLFAQVSFRKRWKFLFIKFRPNCYWWSLVILAKGIFLNVTTVIFVSGVNQIAWLASGTLAYLVISHGFNPWRSFFATLMDVLQHMSLMLVLAFLPYFALVDEVHPQEIGIAIVVVMCLPLLAGASAVGLLTSFRFGSLDLCPVAYLNWRSIVKRAATDFDKIRTMLVEWHDTDETARALEVACFSDLLILREARHIILGDILGQRTMKRLSGYHRDGKQAVAVKPLYTHNGCHVNILI